MYFCFCSIVFLGLMLVYMFLFMGGVIGVLSIMVLLGFDFVIVCFVCLLYVYFLGVRFVCKFVVVVFVVVWLVVFVVLVVVSFSVMSSLFSSIFTMLGLLS